LASSSSSCAESEGAVGILGFVIGLDAPASGALRGLAAKGLDTIVAFYSKAL
jgi:hypothetical protein